MVTSSIKTLARKLARKVLRGIVSLSYDNTGIQRLQVKTLDGDVYELPRVQPYGLTTNPQNDAEAIVLMMDESNGVVIAVDDRRYRLTGLAKGEVALYDDLGSKVHLQRNGKILLQAETKITIDTPDVHGTGNFTADGEIVDLSKSNSLSMSGMRSTYNNHDHTKESVGIPSAEM
jgi:phage baseplate assembly protein V